jgi:hypothetical protein
MTTVEALLAGWAVLVILGAVAVAVATPAAGPILTGRLRLAAAQIVWSRDGVSQVMSNAVRWRR